MRRLAIFVLVLAACAKRSEPPLPGDSVSASGSVQLTPPKFSTMPEPAPLGAIESKLFAPDLVMEHQAAIKLEGTQRESVLKEIDKGQSELTHLQWDLQAEKEKLIAILDVDKVDEKKASDQATRVIEQENKIKSSHLGMLVRIKNLLTPDQQKKLRELRGR